MAHSHGKDQYLSITRWTNNDTNIHTELTSITFGDSEADEADVTTMGDGWREFIAGLKQATFSIEGIQDTLPGTLLPSLLGGTAAPFRYGPQGTADGAPKISGSGFMTAYSGPTGDLDGAVTFGASFRVSGTVSFGTWSSGA